ncbi:MAG: COX15/CtaA family protein [Hyphomicrobiaceae bacterium]
MAHIDGAQETTSTLDTHETAIRVWLWIIALLVLAMAVVGAATRLTDSGLSITEWQPLLGAVPPLSEADWLAAFQKYQAIPEYQRVNLGMTLEEFKPIFWWEWSHRFLGRFIGLAVAGPFLFFWLKGWLSRTLALRLLGLFLLGGLQGAAGWYMVRSGLVDRVDVSQYRLALHLTLAALIFAWTVWLALGIGRAEGAAASAGVRWSAIGLVVLLFLQIAAGAFVAGLDAGLSHNTWPLMDGQLVPDGLLVMSPWFVNLFDNVMTVQFDHRMLAYLVALWITVMAIRSWHGDAASAGSASLLVLAVLAQIALGVWTLLSMVPISLGLAHQAGAFVLLGLAVWHLRRVVG